MAHAVNTSGIPSASSFRVSGFMRKKPDYQNIACAPSFKLATGYWQLLYAASSFTASRNTFVCRSTSSFSVCGDISAMLWKGVNRIPRFIA